MRQFIYLSPGMFGFGRLASFEYFAHLERALTARFAKAGEHAEVHVVDVLPTSSVRRRASSLVELIARTAGTEGAIHLLGHSTGGLDARLVVSPSAVLPFGAAELSWMHRVRSVTTMNTPHYGTPLASFFATTRGQQVLYALSAFTVMGLSLGAQPLALASVLIGIFGRGERSIGIELPLLRRSVDSLLNVVDSARDPGVRSYLRAIEQDQGAMVQLSPEAMDLLLASVADRSGVVYQSTASMSPVPSASTWLEIVGHPFLAASLALFSALHLITGNYDRRYPCASMSADDTPAAGEHNEAVLLRAFQRSPGLPDSDGVVPIRSQLWGRLIWAGLGDHLDVLGHYRDKHPDEHVDERHHDWLKSGSAFDDDAFESLMDAIAGGMLAAAR